MFEPTPGEEYQMMLKDLDPTNTKKEVYQTISDAIEAMNRGYRYSDRLQVPLFKNEWGT